MPRLKKQLHSPKGLLRHTTVEGTLPPIGDEVATDESLGFRWKRLGARTWTIEGPEPAGEIRKQLEAFASHAKDIIELSGKDAEDWERIRQTSEIADQAYWPHAC